MISLALEHNLTSVKNERQKASEYGCHRMIHTEKNRNNNKKSLKKLNILNQFFKTDHRMVGAVMKSIEPGKVGLHLK